MSATLLQSVVIPVYNACDTIQKVVDEVLEVLGDRPLEIVLVNDGSADQSHSACVALHEAHPDVVTYVRLAKNFGEHSAVLAGLHYVTGDYVAILDDDGQNPPAEIPKMIEQLERENLDVVYGRYREKRHSWFRNLGSWFNDRMANIMLRKPKHIYLSSFKVMNRFIVDEVAKYRGPFPYIDGLIFRASANIGQADVEHRPRQAGKSSYTLTKLVKLWLNMFLGFSIAPLRLAVYLGTVMAVLSLLMIVAVVVDKLWLNPDVTVGIPTVLACLSLSTGVQLIMLGTIGEYLGRIFLHQSGLPQFVVRSSQRRGGQDE